MLDLIYTLDNGGIAPMQATAGSAAWDLLVPEGQGRVAVFQKHVTILDFKIRVAIPKDHAGILLPRSGVGSKQGLKMTNTFGLIDSDYRGPIIAKLTLDEAATDRRHNEPFILRAWEPVLQLFIVPIPALRLMEVARLPEAGTERDGGFGSTTERTKEKAHGTAGKTGNVSASKDDGKAGDESVGNGSVPSSSGSAK